MNEISFKDFITLQRGFDLPRKKMKNGIYPVIGSTSIIGYHDEYKVSPPGVITGRSGSLGIVQFTNRKYWPHNTALWVKDFKGNYPKYVYYYLKTIDFYRFNSGASVPTLNRNNLDQLEIEVHNKKTQKMIADILTKYDNLIDQCLQQIRILEEMAQLNYDKWFVKLHYPGFEEDSLVESETYFGKIPKDWEIKKLGEIIKFEKGRKAKDIHKTLEEKRTRYILIDGLKTGNFLFTSDKKGVFVGDKDILMVMDGASSGSMYFGTKGFVGSTLAAIRISNEYKLILYYLYYFLKNNYDLISKNNVGSAIPHANKNFILDLKILIPTNCILQKTDYIFDILHNLIRNLKKKNKVLQNMRDLLIPELILGNIDISKIEINLNGEEEDD